MEFVLAHQLQIVQALESNIKNPKDIEQLSYEKHMLSVLIASSRPERLVQMDNPDGMVGRYEEAAFEQEARIIAANHVRRSRFDPHDPRANEQNWFSAVGAVRSRLGLFVPKSPLAVHFESEGSYIAE